MERSGMSPDLPDDYHAMDDDNDPLSDLKEFVTRLDNQTDLNLDEFKGLYDDDSDDGSDWEDNADFEKITTNLLSYALGKENRTKSTPKAATISRSNSSKYSGGTSTSNSLKTPKGILTPRNANVFNFDDEESSTIDHVMNEEKDFELIEESWSGILDELLADETSISEKKEAYATALQDTSRPNMQAGLNQSDDSEVNHHCHQMSSARMPKSDQKETCNEEPSKELAHQDGMTKERPINDEDTKHVIDVTALEPTVEEPQQKGFTSFDAKIKSIEIDRTTSEEQDQGRKTKISPSLESSSETAKLVSMSTLEVTETALLTPEYYENEREVITLSNLTPMTDKADKADDFQGGLDELPKKGAKQGPEVEEVSHEDSNALNPMKSSVKHDPYEWAYSVWRAKGLMGRSREGGHGLFKRSPVANDITPKVLPHTESKVFVIGKPVQNALFVATPGRDRAGKWNQEAPRDFGNLMQRWKHKSDISQIPDLFSPTQGVHVFSSPPPVKKCCEVKDGNGQEEQMRTQALENANVGIDGAVEMSNSEQSTEDNEGRAESTATADECMALDENDVSTILASPDSSTAIEVDALLGMTILDMSGSSAPAKTFRDYVQIDDGNEGSWDDDSLMKEDEITGMASHCQIASTNHTQCCECSSSIFSGNDALEEFFLPQLGMACTCGTKRSASFLKGTDPTSLENILRPWQVAFCKSFGIRKGDQLVKAHHRSANVLAVAMRKWRKAQGMAKVRTVSCGVALNIWARSCKYFVRSVRMQRGLGVRDIKLPSTLIYLSEMRKQGEWTMTVPVNGQGFRASLERATLDVDFETEVEI